MIGAILFWTAVASLFACAVLFCAALIEGRELTDETLRNRADGDWPPVPPINQPRGD